MNDVLTVRDAEVDGVRVDVTLADGVVRRIVIAGSERPVSDAVLEAHGGALLPGLHDHHVHLLAMAAAIDSVPVGPGDVQDAAGFGAALRSAAAGAASDEWIRAVGYHESVAGELDRYALDAVAPGTPLRVQHRSGALWVLNSAALAAVGADPGHDGRFLRADEWLRGRMPSRRLDLAAVGRRLASCGITGVTDLTPTSDESEVALLAAAVASGELQIGVTITGSADLPAAASPELRRGPVKVVVGDHALPSLDDLLARFRAARSLGRAVAVHCVTREALVLALVAWHEVGSAPGDRIEHGAVVPPEVFADIAALGLTVVTQPSFVRERGDQYLTDVDVADRPHLWRCRSLAEAGIGVAFGSDAPYGSIDPWSVLRTAVDRRTLAGGVLGAGESLAAGDALTRMLGAADAPTVPRSIVVGVRADLCLLDRPLAEMLAAPDVGAVAATLVGGAEVYRR
ncbi:MAG: amidohydrolase family protein [Actinobacteria bacterium]|nr:amidohydrolase family protein [Actinomycetota bacterium]MSW78657.1 amidohydrolase family protein [Actinomycetota bacterium]MSX54018.1 amidohydrolase family protein [Actinomycetota bacterium]MSX94818.1 amidohydrolase family protein [Actinomycetota bacterium]MSZ84148.1 amidohydrolase family protein [Actinomycetota bacterium]